MDELKRLYRDYVGSEAHTVTLLPLSGSARKYYRMHGDGPTLIGCKGVNYAENQAFLTIDRAFVDAGLSAPKVYAVSDDGMSYIQEDLGDNQLFELLKPSLAKGEFSDQQLSWLKEIMRQLPTVQYEVGRRMDWSICFPDKEFNARMVNFDLNYFKYDFLKLTTLAFDEIRLQDDIDRLCLDALDFEGDTFMYRDFQARNIMIKDDKPCYIDFQGGRRGPLQYDLASFLWNAGTHFDASLRRELEEVYLDALQSYQSVDCEDFYRRYRLLTLIRLLQETAAYGFRGIVERKQLFIDCIPAVIKELGELGAMGYKRYPYLSGLLCDLAQKWDGSTILPGFKLEL